MQVSGKSDSVRGLSVWGRDFMFDLVHLVRKAYICVAFVSEGVPPVNFNRCARCRQLCKKEEAGIRAFFVEYCSALEVSRHATRFSSLEICEAVALGVSPLLGC